MKAWGSRLGSLAAALGFCLGMDALFGGIGQDYAFRMAFLAGLYVILSVSLNIINGICGQFSIGHAAFYQIGAFVAGYSSLTYLENSSVKPIYWILMMIPIGAVAAGIVGFIVGLPSLKLRGDYLAIVTLGFGEIIRIIAINVKEVGGSYGMPGIVPIKPLWLVWLIAVMAIAVSRNLLKSAHGLAFIAVREDEVAASAMGVNVTKIKVTAFVLGSMFAGAAGVLLAHFEGITSVDFFKMEISFIILTMVVLGGTGSITGSTLAAVFLFGIPEMLRGMRNAEGQPLLVTGSALIAAMLAIILVVAVVKRIVQRYHGGMWRRLGLYAGAVAAGFVAQFVLSLLLRQIPTLAGMRFELAQLRMVIFAGTLIIVMLLRPQGILAHHEFSWKWLFGLMRRRRAAGAKA
jgi:branched-chain amino acid transport system permease protein